jgi:hypothetical protein
MPFTPFHFGPGLALHALAPKRLSFVSFCAANVLIDAEPLYYMFTTNPPFHRFFHTWPGGTVVALAAIVLLLASRWLASRFNWLNWFNWKEVSLSAMIVGASVGTYSHVLLDSIAHEYLHPFSPLFKTYQPTLSAADIRHGCLLAGIAGVLLLAGRYVMARNAWSAKNEEKP